MERALGRLARRSILSRFRRPGLSSSARPCYGLRSSLRLTVSYLHTQTADPPTHFRVRSFEDVGFQKFLRRGLASAAGGPGEIVVPPFAESVTEGTIASLSKQPGDSVQVDDVIALIETDKVTIDLRATESGTLKELKIKAGDTVKPGQVVGTVAVGDTSGKQAAKPSEKMEEKVADKPTASPPPPSSPPPPPPPSSSPPPPPPQPSGPAFKPPAATSGDYVLPPKDRERRVPMTRLRKRVAARLKDSQNTFAMLTTFNEVDMTNLMELRSKYKDDFQQKHGAKLGFMSAFVKAAVSGLQQQPVVNGVIDGDDIVYRDYIDISIAVGTPKGLVVPVVRGADKLSFAEVETTIAMLGKKANEGKISIDDMAGGTFTISNGGVYGSLLSTPIINPPQSAILGMHSIQKRPMVVGNAIVARPMMYVALTYDHRLIDGREAVLFLRRIKDVIEDPSRLLLDV